jgi:hypothetical protein
MWKIIAVVLWAGIPFCWQPLWGQAPSVGVQKGKEPKSHSDSKKDATEKTERGTAEVPFVVDTEGHKQTPEDAEKTEATRDHAAYVEGRTLLFAGISAYAATALVFIGLGGVIAAIWTLRQIKRQADLTQAQFDQWVELENWRTKKPTDRFTVQVDLVNNTAFPVTISDGYLTVTSDAWKTSETHYFGKLFLTPNKPHLIDIWVGSGVLPEVLRASESASFSVKGMFSHRHRITKQEVIQPLEGNLRCGPWKLDRKWHADYTATVHMNPERAEAEGEASEQKAN